MRVFVFVLVLVKIKLWIEIGGKNPIGVIAQEVENILPELVSTDNNGYKAVDYTKLTPVLIEAMKEQQAIIDSQDKRLEAQDQKIASQQQLALVVNTDANACPFIAPTMGINIDQLVQDALQ